MARKKKSPARREPVWVKPFLAALSNTANIRFACQQAEIVRQTAYDRRKAHPEFLRRWRIAMQEACDALEAVAWKRAQAESDTLLIFLLKAHRPKKYRENVKHEHGGSIGVRAEIIREVVDAADLAGESTVPSDPG